MPDIIADMKDRVEGYLAQQSLPEKLDPANLPELLEPELREYVLSFCNQALFLLLPHAVEAYDKAIKSEKPTRLQHDAATKLLEAHGLLKREAPQQQLVIALSEGAARVLARSEDKDVIDGEATQQVTPSLP